MLDRKHTEFLSKNKTQAFNSFQHKPMEPQYNEIGRAGYYTNSPDNISHKNKIDLFYLAILKIVRNISLKYSNNVGWLIYLILSSIFAGIISST